MLSQKTLQEARSFDPVREFEQADFGDRRLTARCVRVARAMQRSPGASLPRIFATATELAGGYRFFNNRLVTSEALLTPHFAETARRIESLSQWLIVHDTSEIRFEGERDGLGSLSGGAMGFLAHLSLAVTSAGPALPLGALNLELLGRRVGTRRRDKKAKFSFGPDNEHARWERGAAAVEARIGSGQRPIHVMDREGDSYLLLARMLEQGRRFVIRLTHDRSLLNADGTGPARISEAVATLPVQATRAVRLPSRGVGQRRPPKAQKRHPTRTERDANLVMTATSVVLKRPQGAPASLHVSLAINVVRVHEPAPPDDQPPVEWLLLTTEPIQTPVQVQAVVDYYRRRWLIEECFKALKSGCLVEDRGFETGAALKRIFSMALPLACQMLALRTLARVDDRAPATKVLSETQVAVLCAASDKLPPRQRPPPNPTARQALLALAAHGGHLSNNGDPGWLTLARGFDRLREIELGVTLAARVRQHLQDV